MTFRVKELAQDRKMNQEDLARKSGVKIRTVQRIWQNKVRWSHDTVLNALADALGVQVKDLYATDDESYTKDNAISPGHASAFQTA